MPVVTDDNFRPFFQVLVCSCMEDIPASHIFERFRQVITEMNNHTSSHLVEIVQPKLEEISEDNFFTSVLKHRRVPTWYQQEGKIDLSASTKIILDQEYDLFIFYKKEQHYFFNTNCSYIFSVIENTLNKIYEEDGFRFQKLTGEQLNLVLSLFKIEYRSLGIQNHFGAGGSAPDGKTYYSRDASNSLTPSFDAGYGFSYCIGEMQLSKTDKTPFGCSKNKSKIWTTWVNDLDTFCRKCDNIVAWLNSPKKTNPQLDVLVQSTNKNVLKNLEPVEFFLDYFIMEKGMVFLAIEYYSLDWYCQYMPGSKRILFEIREEDVLQSVEIALHYIEADEVFLFEYVNADDAICIAFANSWEQLENRREYDLVKFLNAQQHFTILFNRPFAYRDEECWEDNRLGKRFTKGFVDIKWTNVDIRKESSPAKGRKINILQKIEEYFKRDKEVLFACNDNGANEIADYLILYDNRIILIHAKYAGNVTPRLSVDDIQVVASQTVKNIRYFMQAAYSEETLLRIFKKATKNKLGDFDSFKQKFIGIIQNKETEKECWIVQPGISLAKLKADSKNKMHTILNFVESILKVNNIGFKLLSSK